MSRPPGRPEKITDWKFLDQLCEAGCLGTEIAGFFDMNANAFYRAVEEKVGMTFTEYRISKKDKGEGLIRNKQYQKALEGDNHMLIWLGKNRLKQADTPVELSIDPNTLKGFNDIMGQLSAYQALKIEERSSNNEQKSA